MLSATLASTIVPARAFAAALAEAPMLRALVDSGKLPPVAARLPANPKVVPVHAAIGQYGGTWRMSMAGATDLFSLVRMIGYENLARWKPWTLEARQHDVIPEVEPNIAERIDITDEGRTYTFHLRRGMRWSDGHPFGADDILFWYSDVFSNAELFPSHPIWSMRGGKPVVVEKIDDATVVFRFAEPEGLLLQWMATTVYVADTNVPTAYPKHYLVQFHKTYTPSVDGANWVRNFHDRANKWSNPDVPTLNPWVVTRGIGQASGARVMAERNPYYWKVDAQGKQLPYIDHATFDIVSDNQVQLLKALGGDYDLVDSYLGFVTTPEHKALFAEMTEKRGYGFYKVIPDRASLMLIALNLVHKNPVKRALFQNKNFRCGLSLAINRNEIIDLVFLGQGLPYQMVERPDSLLFNKEMATQFTDYDVAAANSYLDKAGLTKRNGNGTRLGPDGQPVQITIDCSTLRQPWIDSAELVKRYWAAVGIEMFLNTESTSLMQQRTSANDHDAAIWSAAAGTDTIFDPKYYFPFSLDSYFAIPWARAYQKLPGAETPPPAAVRGAQLYDRLQNNVLTAEDRIATFREIMSIAKQEFYTIGIVQPTDDYGVINNRMRNVPQTMIASTQYPHPGPVNPEQFWFAPA
jgi:peptide/nickel transport system substrate-binding protein